MGKSNKGARRMLERIFGKICMIEHLGIHSIPQSKRKKIKGYRQTDDQLTYHHIHERVNGGRTTISNGALVKGYNHQWLHKLPEKQKQDVNNAILEFKATVIQIVGDEVRTIDGKFICFDTLDPQEPDTYKKTIKVEDNDEEILIKREKFKRAREQQKFRRKVREGIDEFYEDK